MTSSKPPHPHPPGPTALLGTPSHAMTPRTAAPARVVAVPRSVPTPELTLTVSAAGKVYLSRALALHLRLKHGQNIDLVPPRGPWNSRLPWHLDIREGTPLASLTLQVNDAGVGKDYKPQFNCCQVLHPSRFRWRHEQLPRLTLLLTEPALIPGFLPLYPVYAETT